MMKIIDSWKDSVRVLNKVDKTGLLADDIYLANEIMMADEGKIIFVVEKIRISMVNENVSKTEYKHEINLCINLLVFYNDKYGKYDAFCNNSRGDRNTSVY